MSYQWFEGGSPIQGANEQEWTAYWVGSYQVQVSDANGCTAISDPVQVLTVGIEEGNNGVFRLWPSPVREVLNIATPATSAIELRIMGSDGRLVRTQRIVGGGTVQLSVGDLADGTYIMDLLSEGKRWRQRFVRMP